MLLEAALFILAVALLYVQLMKQPKGLPPGEFGWPLVGALPSKDKSFEEQVRILRQKHGDIFTWKMGSRLNIFLCNYKSVKAAFSRTELNQRPNMYSFDIFTEFKKNGIFNSNDLHWKNARGFMMKQLKELGMGKSFLEDSIHFEAEGLVKDFRKHCDQTLPELPWSLNVAVLNVIWKMTADKRYDVDDEEILYFEKLMDQAFKESQGVTLIFDMMPWLVTVLPEFVKNLMGAGAVRSKVNEIKEFMMKFIKAHQAEFNPAREPRDYIDAYLLEMHTKKNDPDFTFSIDDLWVTIFDIFSAGTITSAFTVRWAVLYLIKYPEVQAKLHRQIDEVVPKGRLLSLQDKDRLPYLEAVIQETHRMCSMTPIGLAHSPSQDTEIEGFFIPKESLIMCNVAGCHHDPAIWEKPQEFYPEHFLDHEGNYVAKKEGLFPFLVGRRMCPGEPLARMELFLFVGALLQNFKFTAPPGAVLNLNPDPNLMVLNAPQLYDVIITERK